MHYTNHHLKTTFVVAAVGDDKKLLIDNYFISKNNSNKSREIVSIESYLSESWVNGCGNCHCKSFFVDTD